MPSDLLVPAFIVTLVANAILIAVAMRGLMTGRHVDEPHPAPPRPRDPRPITSPAPTASATASTGVAPAAGWTSARPGGASPDAEPRSPTPPPNATGGESPVSASSAPPPLADADPSVTPAAATRTRPVTPRVASAEVTPAGAAAHSPTAPASTPAAPTAVAGAAVAKAAKPGRRRRFALPPLDDDHEKVNRSIESFLASGEVAAERTPTTTPTTVALVTVTGMDTTAIADAIERALRTAARGRGPGRVERAGPGRWRIVLVATGELAARSYGHRLRAGVDPLIAATGEAGRVLVATATVLGDPIEVANATAERRLAAMLAAETEEPRAAAD